MQPVPVLTYHATNVAGNDYVTNDHVAFAEDLRMLDAAGCRIVPLTAVVDALLDGAPLPDRAVAMTLDDGTDFDFHDLPHPSHGRQRGMLNLLRDFVATFGAARQPGLCATSFVIASPEARRELDRDCLVDRGWYNDDWWREAVASGLMPIANHSFTHNHPSVREAAARGRTGTFRSIDSWPLAEREIRQARDYIDRMAPNPAAALFAYPYGDTNAFLVDEYLPRGPEVTGVRAAFSTEPAHVARGASRWNLPRYVCGAHWRSPEELARLVAG